MTKPASKNASSISVQLGTGPPWWEGDWPGIDSLNDLEKYIDDRLNTVISLSRYGSNNAGIGIALGQQTAVNTVRWLARHGDGELPAMPATIATTDDIERGLEPLLRLLRAKIAKSENSVLVGTTDESERGTGSRVKTSPCHDIAFAQYEWATDKNPALGTDRDVYNYLVNAVDIPGEAEIPVNFSTFARYLRHARRAQDKGKYAPRAGRSYGSSVVRSDQI